MENGSFKVDKWGYGVKTHSDSCIAAINSYYDQENASLYEKSVFEAVNYLISPNRDDDLAVELHSQLLRDFPKDLASLKRAQVLCFYMARADLSLELVEKVLPANEEENYIYGMLAFPLLELGRYADAEKAAKKGFEINSADPWTQHALCHIYQYQCCFKEAVQFMEKCSSSWGSLSSFMFTHNWWHVALCYLEGHSSLERVREVYDLYIWKELERSDSTPPEVYLNAVALLLRVYIRDAIDVFEDRLKILANRLTDKSFWYLEWHLDVLTLWALACTGEVSKAEDLLEEALFQYGKGDDKAALELLEPEFDAVNYKIIGASDEQADVFNEVWIILLLNNGHATRAIEAIEKQLKKREGAVFLWRLLERAHTMLGRKEAISIGEKARALQNTSIRNHSIAGIGSPQNATPPSTAPDSPQLGRHLPSIGPIILVRSHTPERKLRHSANAFLGLPVNHQDRVQHLNLIAERFGGKAFPPLMLVEMFNGHDSAIVELPQIDGAEAAISDLAFRIEAIGGGFELFVGEFRREMSGGAVAAEEPVEESEDIVMAALLRIRARGSTLAEEPSWVLSKLTFPGAVTAVRETNSSARSEPR
nr:tetratricopeptide repeat protein 38 isoform X1 [Ipomoea batatas]GME17606.1 tetratricopeptide repeat protein 38 isoform X1 [Ipomoea batatas]